MEKGENNFSLNSPLYLQIARILEREIYERRYPGNKLPSERKLCERFGVSTITIKQSLNLLASKGLIYRRPRKGTFIIPHGERERNQVIRKEVPGNGNTRRGIGILIPCVTGYFYPGIIKGVEDVCWERGYYLILGTYSGRPQKEREYMEKLLREGVRGLIVLPSYNSHLNPFYKTLQELNFPLVLVDTMVDGVEADFVATDNVKGAYLGTRHLIRSGCKRIAFISGWFGSSTSRERFLGYREALEEMGIPVRRELIREGNFTQEFGHSAIKKILSKHRIDGIFSANEPITLGILRAIKELNLKIPEDIKMLSFDEVPLPPELNYPVIFITQPKYEIGRVAAEILLERVEKQGKKGEGMSYRRILLHPGIGYIPGGKIYPENLERKEVIGV